MFSYALSVFHVSTSDEEVVNIRGDDRLEGDVEVERGLSTQDYKA